MSNFTTPLEYDDLGNEWYRLRRPVIMYFTLYEVLGNCELLESIVKQTGIDRHMRIYIKAPVGFRTDFASIPKKLRWAISPKGKYSKAAVLHDMLYQYHGSWFNISVGMTDAAVRMNRIDSREFADKLFLFAMKVAGVNWLTRNTFYTAVVWGGAAYYHFNRTGVESFFVQTKGIKIVSISGGYAKQFPIYTSYPNGAAVRCKSTDPGYNKVLVNGVQHGAYVTPCNFGHALLILNGNKLMGRE